MMDERSARNEASLQLLDLIPNERSEWDHMRGEETKLELSLAPPGGEQDWSLNHHRTKNLNSERDESLLFLGYLPHHATNNHNHNNNGFQIQKNMPSTRASNNNNKGGSSSSSFLHQFPSSSLSSPSSQPQSMPVMGKDASQAPSRTKVIDQLQNNSEKKVFSSPSSAVANTAVPNTSQKRTAPGPVVGWPPIRSFRKNLASSSSSKPPTPPESPHQHHHHPNDKVASGTKLVENNYGKGMFVKINMDGVPIGRKVDLNAYDSYENLSTAVDELFRGLLAAQRDSSGGGRNKQLEEEKPITALLDGSGEYTLVYEDNEGDRMLVGDVPWNMFISTVKRLRVLKSTELSAFTLGGKQYKETTA